MTEVWEIWTHHKGVDIQKILVMGTSGRYVKDALGNRTTSLGSLYER